MSDHEFQVAQSAPRPRRERPKQDLPDDDGTRRPAPKDQPNHRPAPRRKPQDTQPQLPLDLRTPPGVGFGFGVGSLQFEPADHNSIELASAPSTLPKGPNEIT